jgi:two-component system LytT family response regulator
MKNTISIVLVDDEENSRVVLRNLLSDFFPEAAIVGEAANVEEAYDIIQKKHPALVFLDIQMPRADGFMLLKKFPEIPFEVIFVTSYDKYAINAIRFNALDYLLKPVEVSELKIAMTRAEISIGKKPNTDIRIGSLLESIQTGTADKKIAVHAGENVVLIDVSRIAYIQADGSYCTLTTIDKGEFITAKTLKDFEDYIGEHTSLVRIHRSCMINAKQIKKYSKGEPCMIEMNDGKIFEVARRKKTLFLEKLK